MLRRVTEIVPISAILEEIREVALKLRWIGLEFEQPQRRLTDLAPGTVFNHLARYRLLINANQWRAL